MLYMYPSINPVTERARDHWLILQLYTYYEQSGDINDSPNHF